jgi:hypothetical protein
MQTQNNTSDPERSSTPTIHQRINRANRLAEDKVQQAAKIIAADPRKLDSEIAVQCGISRESVNAIRLLISRAPELWRRVQAGELSVGAATTLMRHKGQHRVSPNNAVTVQISLGSVCKSSM